MWSAKVFNQMDKHRWKANLEKGKVCKGSQENTLLKTGGSWKHISTVRASCEIVCETDAKCTSFSVSALDGCRTYASCLSTGAETGLDPNVEIFQPEIFNTHVKISTTSKDTVLIDINGFVLVAANDQLKTYFRSQPNVVGSHVYQSRLGHQVANGTIFF